MNIEFRTPTAWKKHVRRWSAIAAVLTFAFLVGRAVWPTPQTGTADEVGRIPHIPTNLLDLPIRGATSYAKYMDSRSSMWIISGKSDQHFLDVFLKARSLDTAPLDVDQSSIRHDCVVHGVDAEPFLFYCEGGYHAYAGSTPGLNHVWIWFCPETGRIVIEVLT